VGNRLEIESPYQIQTLRVFDLMGKEVLHKTPNQQKLTLNTFTLAPGAYLLHVETAEGVQMVKLVKE
jgi:predicted metal-dependent enzyme (double-stranded beta helix superfamily)